MRKIAHVKSRLKLLACLLLFPFALRAGEPTPASQQDSLQEKRSIEDQIMHGELLNSKSTRTHTISRKNVNKVLENGLTPLMATALSGNIQQGKHLLSLGAKVSLKNKTGDTALCMALSNEQSAWAQWLMRSRSETLNDICADGQSPAGVAINANDLPSLQLIHHLKPRALLMHDKDGNNYLHLAAKYGSVELIEYLKSLGVKTNERNRLGKTPGDIAVDSQSPHQGLFHAHE